VTTGEIQHPSDQTSLSAPYATPLLLGLIAGALAALIGGVGDGRWSLSPDWKLGLMFGVSAMLAGSVQVFLQQSFELTRTKRRLLKALDDDQTEARATLAAIADARTAPTSQRPVD
jgi:hypothetical protein